MDQYSAASAYQQAAARSTSAVGQVVALYDTILRDFRRALAAIESGNIEARVFEMNHALTVTSELQGVLDFQRGGEAAKSLDRFYKVTQPMILDASVSASPEKTLQLIDLYQGIRNAWQEAEKKVPHSEPKQAGPRLGAARTQTRMAETESAGQSRWNA